MQNNVFLRLAQERYTTKHYNGQQIPREEFDTLLEILRLTPTSVNAQALHYFTATSQEARERLLPAFPEFNRDRITGASDVVVFTVPKTLTEGICAVYSIKRKVTDASPMQK
ncbi:nitroreductase family protein [Sutterella wadsworthensis]|uniref:nitroreductase family protein n=1 Tax=Sutterella wadsworthensis TaxID=40545 RepID=UPI0039671891